MELTIILPISRPDYLPRIFAQLELLDCDRAQTNLFTYVDGGQALFEKARNLTVQSKFAQRLCWFRSKGQPSDSSVRRRRERIADIHNEIQEKIGEASYVLLIEDDTLIPLNTIQKLTASYGLYPHAGFVSGVQVGRWGFQMLGGWRTNDPYEPTIITSIPPIEKPELIEVDAAGLYCCMMRKSIYLRHEFAPFETILGPDVNLGLFLRREGFKNYMDTSIQCAHLTKKGEIKVSGTPTIQVEFTKIEGEEKWTQRTLE